jgi:predicted RNA-binding Zn ribbon-like protein
LRQRPVRRNGSSTARSGGAGRAASDSDDLCIRFVNTVAWRLRDPREERLATPDALLRWLDENGLGDPQRLARLAGPSPATARAAASLHRASVELREAIYAVFRARIERAVPRAADLDALNAWLARPAPGVAIGPSGGGIAWRPSSADADPRDLLRPIVVSAADLLTGARAGKLRQCADDRGCGWLFVDESRAQNRRWCSMGDCGNRAKARRHRARKRSHPGRRE